MNSSYEKIKSVNEKLTLFLFKEEAIIYSSLSKSLYLLNALGIYAWLLYEEGLNKEDVLAHCLELRTKNQNGNAVNTAEEESELPKLIEELNTLFKSAEIKNKLENEEELWLKEIKFGNKVDKLFAESAHYKILDSIFYFSFPSKQVEDLLSPILEQFKLNPLTNEEIETEALEKALFVKIESDQQNTYRLSINNFLFSWEIPSERLLSFFLDRLRKLAFTYSSYFLAAHSAVLSKGEVCLMLPAVSYSGKSTLSAVLVSNGYQYFSDEMAVLDEQFNARPVPLGLGLKSGSWQLLKDYMPELAEQAAQERWDGVPIKYLSVPYQNNESINAIELSREKKTISHLVFPQYTQGSAAKLTPLSIPQAIYRLYQAGYTQGKELSLSSLEKIINWLESIPSYSFEFDKLQEASLCLEDLQINLQKNLQVNQKAAIS